MCAVQVAAWVVTLVSLFRSFVFLLKVASSNNIPELAQNRLAEQGQLGPHRRRVAGRKFFWNTFG
jgi:hypothetical protein